MGGLQNYGNGDLGGPEMGQKWRIEDMGGLKRGTLEAGGGLPRAAVEDEEDFRPRTGHLQRLGLEKGVAEAHAVDPAPLMVVTKALKG